MTVTFLLIHYRYCNCTYLSWTHWHSSSPSSLFPKSSCPVHQIFSSFFRTFDNWSTSTSPKVSCHLPSRFCTFKVICTPQKGMTRTTLCCLSFDPSSEIVLYFGHLVSRSLTYATYYVTRTHTRKQWHSFYLCIEFVAREHSWMWARIPRITENSIREPLTSHTFRESRFALCTFCAAHFMHFLCYTNHKSGIKKQILLNLRHEIQRFFLFTFYFC